MTTKTEASDAVAYLDELRGMMIALSQQGNITRRGEDAITCNPKAFGEIAENLARCSKIIGAHLIAGGG